MHIYRPTDSSETGGDIAIGLETANNEQPVGLDSFSNPARAAENLAHFLTGPAESYLALHISNWREGSDTILVVQDKGGYWERVALIDSEDGIMQRAVKR